MHDLGAQASDVIARQFETFFRLILRGPDVVNTPQFLRYLTHEPHPFGNFAIVSDTTSPEQTAASIEPLLGLATPSAVLFPASPSTEVDAFVKGHGYILAEAMPTMAVRIDSLAPPAPPEGYAFSQVTTRDDDAWCDVFARGYGVPRRIADDFGPRAAADLLNNRTICHYAITKDGEIVSTSVLYLDDGIAGVYCVSTLPEHRGRGLAAFATAQPLRQVRELGYQTGILQSSLMGESVYRRLGFQQFGVMPVYVCIPPGVSFAH
jgi:predicted GNAT family acetyltransferase